MKILFCSPNPLDKKLGAARVILGISEELERLGCSCTLVSPSDLAIGVRGPAEDPIGYAEALRNYLQQHADAYDIVEYDHGHLPYPRSSFPPKPLFVARSVLLGNHFLVTPVPVPWRSILKHWIKGTDPLGSTQEAIDRIMGTVIQADLINVSNTQDVKVLRAYGIPQNKIFMAPFGIRDAMFPKFDEIALAPHASPRIAFVGTFDRRKGGEELPKLFDSIHIVNPEVTLKLLGTGRSREMISARFPKRLLPFIEIIPEYDENQLPRYLQDCRVGIFPSYIEGFGIGALEMMAAGLPVVAYDSPGPCDFVDSSLRVPRGEWRELSEIVVRLLRDSDFWETERKTAISNASQYRWSKIAQVTEQEYRSRLRQHRDKVPV